MSNNGENGFCVLSKKIMSWKWYKNNNTKSVFIHCLLKANYKDNIYHGVKIKRGQFITSYQKLAEELGLTKNVIRTTLKHLQKTTEINTQTNNQFTIITVNKYDEYQKVNTRNTHKITHNLTPTNNINNNINTLSLTENDFKNYKENVYLTNKQYNDLLVLTGDETILNKLISDLSNNIDAARDKPFDIGHPKAHFARLKKYYEQTQKNIRKDNKNEQYKQKQSDCDYQPYIDYE